MSVYIDYVLRTLSNRTFTIANGVTTIFKSVSIYRVTKGGPYLGGLKAMLLIGYHPKSTNRKNALCAQNKWTKLRVTNIHLAAGKVPYIVCQSCYLVLEHELFRAFYPFDLESNRRGRRQPHRRVPPSS